MAKGPEDVTGFQDPSQPAGERRLVCRYPVRMELEYRLITGGETIGTGRGRTVNISSRGILFESEKALPQQMIIQLCVDWLGRPSSNVNVELHVAGWTVRQNGNLTAVAIDSHEFRMGRGPRIQYCP